MLQNFKGERIVKRIVVDIDNVRLDAYIAKKCEELSRTMIQRLIENGNVLVDGKEKKISYKVQIGEVSIFFYVIKKKCYKILKGRE